MLLMPHLPTHRMDDTPPHTAAEHPRTITLVAVRQGDQWASLSPELGVASCGDTAEEALRMLQAAIIDVLEFEREGGPSAGAPIAAEELQALLDSHEGDEPVASRRIDLDALVRG
jgi:predicted RNase H-like HicB family nuclease